MTIKTSVALLTGGLFLAGCVIASQPTYYAYRQDTTNAQKSSDVVDCKVEAANRVPVNRQIGSTPVFHTPVTVTPMTTMCSGYSCTTTGGQVIGGETYGGQVYSYDANNSLRQEVALQCLSRKGYSLIATTTCDQSQIPKGLSVSPNDRLLPPPSKFCLAPVTPEIGMPVALP